MSGWRSWGAVCPPSMRGIDSPREYFGKDDRGAL